MSRPVRTCLGCRERVDKSELLRLVWHRDETGEETGAGTSGTLLVDPDQRQPGRGAYLHRTSTCLDEAVRRRALVRALRAPGLDRDTVVDLVSDVLGPPGSAADLA